MFNGQDIEKKTEMVNYLHKSGPLDANDLF